MQTYCERCGPGLFDEPINASSNVVFLLAAWAGWRLARSAGVLTFGIWTLVGLAVCIGVGSALWHTFATEWAMILDVVPISLFQLVFLWLYGRHAARLPVLVVLLGLAGYVGLGVWLMRFDAWLNGAVIYAPTLALGVLAGTHHRRTARRSRYSLLASSAVFVVALVCRTIDLVVCRQLPVGTHFLWHVLNGFVVYLAMLTVVSVWVDRREQ